MKKYVFLLCMVLIVFYSMLITAASTVLEKQMALQQQIMRDTSLLPPIAQLSTVYAFPQPWLTDPLVARTIQEDEDPIVIGISTEHHGDLPLVSPDGECVAIPSNDPKSITFRNKLGHTLGTWAPQTLVIEHPTTSWNLYWAPDSQALALKTFGPRSGTAKNLVFIIDRCGKELAHSIHKGYLLQGRGCWKWSPDNQQIALSDYHVVTLLGKNGTKSLLSFSTLKKYAEEHSICDGDVTAYMSAYDWLPDNRIELYFHVITSRSELWRDLFAVFNRDGTEHSLVASQEKNLHASRVAPDGFVRAERTSVSHIQVRDRASGGVLCRVSCSPYQILGEFWKESAHGQSYDLHVKLLRGPRIKIGPSTEKGLVAVTAEEDSDALGSCIVNAERVPVQAQLSAFARPSLTSASMAVQAWLLNRRHEKRN